jgi:hypothetical protein
MLTAGASYGFLARFLLGIGVVSFSATAVYNAQRELMSGIISFAREVCRTNRDAMQPSAVVGIDGTWNHRRNGSVHILDMIDLDSGLVVDSEIVERLTKTGLGNYRGSSHGMEVEAMRRLIVRWEDDHKVRMVITDHGAKMGKVIREPTWQVEHECDAHHAKSSLRRFYENKLSASERQHLYGLGDRLTIGFNTVLYEPISRDPRTELSANTDDHYRGLHAKCRDSHHQGDRWRHRNDPDPQLTMLRLLGK